jgi:hypothetical protein
MIFGDGGRVCLVCIIILAIFAAVAFGAAVACVGDVPRPFRTFTLNIQK